MEHRLKRSKQTKESVVADFTSSIDNISKNMKSVSESYSEILKANKAVVTYLRNMEELEKQTLKETAMDQTHASKSKV